jgi:hypothetical protein
LSTPPPPLLHCLPYFCVYILHNIVNYDYRPRPDPRMATRMRWFRSFGCLKYKIKKTRMK